jgi:hypothetical protein
LGFHMLLTHSFLIGSLSSKFVSLPAKKTFR